MNLRPLHFVSYYRTMGELKDQNKQAGKFFFSRGATRFFRSKIESRLILGRWFITSEQFSDETPRRYTVREGTPDGDIKTVEGFQTFASKADAMDAIGALKGDGIVSANYYAARPK